MRRKSLSTQLHIVTPTEVKRATMRISQTVRVPEKKTKTFYLILCSIKFFWKNVIWIMLDSLLKKATSKKILFLSIELLFHFFKPFVSFFSQKNKLNIYLGIVSKYSSQNWTNGDEYFVPWEKLIRLSGWISDILGQILWNVDEF